MTHQCHVSHVPHVAHVPRGLGAIVQPLDAWRPVASSPPVPRKHMTGWYRIQSHPKSYCLKTVQKTYENMFAHVCIGSFLMLLNVSSLRFGICLQVQFSCVLASPWGAFVSRNLPFQGWSPSWQSHPKRRLVEWAVWAVWGGGGFATEAIKYLAFPMCARYPAKHQQRHCCHCFVL